MDLSSTNIVLDKNWNARLIDFGLGREMNEGQSWVTQTTKFGKKGYWPTANCSKLRVHEDYYNFGVVIRELLTGVAPFIYEDNQLRKSSEMIIEMQLQKNIWTDLKEASSLIKLSTKCLKSREDKNVSSADIVKEIKKMFQDQYSTRSTSNTSTCDLCIVNPSVDGKRAPPHQCSERVNVCTSCMRNSHVNPIRCPTCNETVFPKIGHTYAAVLIAGNDDENEGLAKSFRSDVLALKDVLSSKCPCVIGIRDENIKLIAPSSPGKADKLNLQVHEAFRSLESKQNLGTLLVYFTGHYFPDKGFTLGGPDDVLTLTEIQDEIRNIYTQWGETARILMFLDCCEAPYVPNISKHYVKMIQINACRPDEKCFQSVSGSKFRIFFCQALTRRAFNKKCYNFNLSSSETECEDCVMSEEIITVQQLQT
ncbi:uncharacterized protein LOC123535003 [Mercenaria mercenaria]|uniref:uncharacterized protein LOC123535003 n=1 Tax=Mercenaria mercenaria TaxID=6596 RepID=UPI00234EF147|nr:uncharacterized protein LOC123535003 [Mercenaria mercenaria]